MSDPFEPSGLVYSRGGSTAPRARPARRVQGYFLCGPVPWPWLQVAARLPGRVLHVSIVLWFWSGRRKTRTVAISLSSIARDFGFDRSSASRALATLARAGLVSVRRAAGRKAWVTILDAPEPAGQAGSPDSGVAGHAV